MYVIVSPCVYQGIPAGGSLSFPLWIPCQVCLLFSLLLLNKLNFGSPASTSAFLLLDPPWTTVALIVGKDPLRELTL